VPEEHVYIQVLGYRLAMVGASLHKLDFIGRFNENVSVFCRRYGGIVAYNGTFKDDFLEIKLEGYADRLVYLQFLGVFRVADQCKNQSLFGGIFQSNRASVPFAVCKMAEDGRRITRGGLGKKVEGLNASQYFGLAY